jgi:tetratricopeptide (TPR) repeat protein
MLNDWPAAIETYRKLWRLSPEQLEYGLRLAAAQLHESSIDALHTIAALRTLPPPQGNDPRIDLLEASVLTDQDLVAARAAAERAISKASASRSTLMMARGYGILCEQDAGLGTEMQRSVEECEQARTSYMDAGDRNNAARTLNDMAGIYYSHGDLPHAEQLWKEALIEFGTVDDVQGIAASSSNLGEALLTRGNLHAARALFKKASQGYAAISDQDGLASVFVDLGSVAFEAGDMRAAKSDFQRASELALQNGDKSVAADGMHGTGDVLVEAADFEGARNSYRRALELREQVGQKQTSAESRLALARVGLLSGHAAEVETSIRDCREQFHAEHQIDDELSAGLLLVRDLLQLKRGPEAQQEFVLLQPLRSITQNRFLQLRFAIEEGRLLADRAHNAEAAAKLQSVSKEAAVGGFQELQMEASLLCTQMAGVGSRHQRAGQQMALLRAQQIQNGYLLLANSILPEK